METLTNNEKHEAKSSNAWVFAGFIFCMLTGGCMIGWAFTKLILFLH